jgi:hypothetical protein
VEHIRTLELPGRVLRVARTGWETRMAAAAPATLMLAGDRPPLARGQRTDQAPADPRREPLIRHGGHLALVSELKRLVATVEMFLIAGTGSADGVSARHRGRRKPGV